MPHATNRLLQSQTGAARETAEQSKPKMGAGHASAMLRSGAKELAAVLPAFSESVQPVEEYGLVLNKLPSEIADSKQGPKMQVQHNMELEM